MDWDGDWKSDFDDEEETGFEGLGVDIRYFLQEPTGSRRHSKEERELGAILMILLD